MFNPGVFGVFIMALALLTVPAGGPQPGVHGDDGNVQIIDGHAIGEFDEPMVSARALDGVHKFDSTSADFGCADGASTVLLHFASRSSPWPPRHLLFSGIADCFWAISMVSGSQADRCEFAKIVKLENINQDT